MALPEIKTILYATSLGKHTRPVFRHAVQLASLYNARIQMLHVVEPMGDMGQALIQNYLPKELIAQIHNEGIEEILKSMRDRVTRFCQEELETLDQTPLLDIVHQVAEGNTTDEILNAAKQHSADMIILGAENRLGHHSHTSQQVMRSAKIPVLIIPTGKQYS